MYASSVCDAGVPADRRTRFRRHADAAACVTSLVAALEARDGHTCAHSRAVVPLAAGVAAALGVPPDEARAVEQVATLHDIGKIGVPDHVLAKPGPLSEDEWEAMRRHPEIGERILLAIPQLAHLAPAVRAEHERWDGRGYPDGLAGEEIPLASRIVFACDAFHAMTSTRPYRAALSRAVAVEELVAGSGSQFEPAVVEALLDRVQARDC